MFLNAFATYWLIINFFIPSTRRKLYCSLQKYIYVKLTTFPHGTEGYAGFQGTGSTVILQVKALMWWHHHSSVITVLYLSRIQHRYHDNRKRTVHGLIDTIPRHAVFSSTFPQRGTAWSVQFLELSSQLLSASYGGKKSSSAQHALWSEFCVSNCYGGKPSISLSWLATAIDK